MVATAMFVGLSDPPKATTAATSWRSKVDQQRKDDILKWNTYRKETTAAKQLARFTPIVATPTPTKPKGHRRYAAAATGKRVFMRREGWIDNFEPTSNGKVKRKGDRDPLPRWKQRQQPVQEKPNYIAPTVGKGSYPKDLEKSTTLATIHVDRVTRSGLDFGEDIVPLYSSFTPDNKFIDSVLRKLETYKIEGRKTKPRNRDDATPLLHLIDELTRRKNEIKLAAVSARRIRQDDDLQHASECVQSRRSDLAIPPVAPALPRGVSVLGDANPASSCHTPVASSPCSILAPTPGPSTSTFSSKVSYFVRPTSAPTTFIWDRFTPISLGHDN